MAEYSRRKGAGDVLAGERERTLAIAVRRRASSIYMIGRAFEEEGCSCHPYRERLKQLEGDYEAEIDRFRASLDGSELGRELKGLRERVVEIDRREHPSLDAQARQAHPYLAVWLLDQVREGNSGVLESDDYQMATAYAQAWIGGWRPRSLNKRKRGAYQASECLRWFSGN